MNDYRPNDNHEINDEYLDSVLHDTVVTHQTKRRKLWLPVAAVVTAVTVAATAIGVSAAAPGAGDEAAKEAANNQVSLMLAGTDEVADSSSQQTGGYVLTDVSDVVDEVLPSVVSITSRTLVDYMDNYQYFGNGDMGDIFDFFFGDSDGRSRGGDYYYEGSKPENEEQQQEEEEPEEVDYAMGSGTIVAQNDDEILILTSYHVVEDGSSLYVTFIDGTSADGVIKAADQMKDIAIVSIPVENVEEETLKNIKPATISTESPKVGDGCIVLGNALGYGISVTTGIVSALDREIYAEGRQMTVIQTDAAINNGNSGGCMLNSKGEVIGISEAKVYSSLVEGMCYAIPVASNIDMIQSLMNTTEEFDPNELVTGSGNAYLGIIRGRDVNSELAADFGMPEGVYVNRTIAGGGAEDAGILAGDIIVGMDGNEIKSFEELSYQLSLHQPGDVVSLEVYRLDDGEYVSITVDVTLTERPD